MQFDREGHKPNEFLGEGSLEKFLMLCKKLANVHPVDELYDNMIFYINTFKQLHHDDMKTYIAKEKIAWERLQEATALMNAEDGVETQKVKRLNPFIPNFEDCYFFVALE